jgi:cell division protein FtsI (penicillin-binding protein 3)
MKSRASRTPRRRTVLALAVILAVMCGFLVRLVDVQVLSASATVQQSVVEPRKHAGDRRGPGEDRRRQRHRARREPARHDLQMDPYTMTQQEEDHAEAAVGGGLDKIATIIGESGDAVRRRSRMR